MGRKVRDMPTPEQQYAADQAKRAAHALREQAQAAESEVGRLTAPRRREAQGHVTAEFGPHSASDQARVDQLLARARDLRAAADTVETAEQPKKKRGWFW